MHALLFALLTVSSTPAVEIRVVADDGWGQATAENVQRHFEYTAKDLLKYFPERKLQPIIVNHSTGMPITLYRRGTKGETLMYIASTDFYLSQYAYQFSHELTHVLAGYETFAPNSTPNMWFEESICMVGSLFTMRQMATSWRSNAPYESWKSYAPQLGQYVDDVLKNPKHQLPENTTLAQWYRINEAKLRSGVVGTGEAREMQAVIGGALLPLFEKAPENWPAVGYLNKKKTGDSTFKDYLDAWEESAPAKYKPFVQEVRAKFEVTA